MTLNTANQSKIEVRIRPIAKADNAAIAQVIRMVSKEYGLSEDKGFSVADPTLDSLFEVYQAPLSHYWVIEHQGQVMGGVGIAPLQGNQKICELQKMYFLPEVRGQGFARKMTLDCFAVARALGFKQIYLETTACLREALELYQSLGFIQLEYHLADTGHDACEIPMLFNL